MFHNNWAVTRGIDAAGQFVDPFNNEANSGLGNVVRNLDVTDDRTVLGGGAQSAGTAVVNAIDATGQFIDPFNTSAESGLGNVVRNLDPTDNGANQGLGNVVQNFDITDPSTVLGGFEVGANDTPLADIANAGIDYAGDQIAGAGGEGGGGDQNPALNAILPYKIDQLGAAQDLFNNGDPLTPDLSPDTLSYIDSARTRATDGSPILDSARTGVDSVLTGSNPYTGLYDSLYSGEIGGSDPALQGLDAISGRVGSNPALQGFNQLENRAGENPLVNASNEQINRVNPTNEFNTNLMNADINAGDPSTQFYRNNLEKLGENRAFNELGKTVRGDYLNSNPYLDNIFEQGSRKLTDTYGKAMDKVNASYNLSGGFGSSARRDALTGKAIDMTDSLGNLYAGIYGGNYQQERGRQLQGAGLLGGFSDAATGRIMSGVDSLGRNYQTGIDRNIQGAGALGRNYISDVGLDYQGIGNIGGQYNVDTGLLSDVNNGRSNIYNADTTLMRNINNDRSTLYNQGLDRQVQGAGLGGAAYNTDVNNRLSAVNPALNLANQDYTDLGVLQNIGGIQDNQNTRVADEPWRRVDLYGNAIGGIPSTAGQAQGANPIMGALGGAAAGSALGWPGAIGGGILGYFGSR